jgi:integrase
MQRDCGFPKSALKVRNIDNQRMVMRIEHGKGGKERYVILSEALLGILRNYWRLARPPLFLFPGRASDTPIDTTVLHAACRSATAAAGLDKRVSVHVLRHMLRRPSAGKRRQHPHHPGVARSRESVDDGALHARLHAAHWQYRQPVGSALAERDAAGIVGDRGRRSNWPTSFAATARPMLN